MNDVVTYGNLSNYCSNALYLYSIGQKDAAEKVLKKSALLLNKLIDKINDKQLRKGFLKESSCILTTFEELSESRNILDVSQKIIYLSSKIGNFMFYPWRRAPLLYFPSKSSVFFNDPDGLLKLSDSQYEVFKSWERPTVALGTLPVMGTDGAETLCQDYLDDCSIVASLLSIYFLEKRASKNILLKNLYPQDSSGAAIVSPSGIYCVKLFVNGCERMVTVDDYLPTTKTKENSLFIRSQSNPGLLWPAILEKAYLKVMGGYNFLGSYSASDTFAMTSWIPEYIYLDAYFQESSTSSRDALWNKTYSNFRKGNVMVCVGTGPISSEEALNLGLISDHDYAILDLQEIQDPKSDTGKKRIALIKNPWLREQETRIVSPLQLPSNTVPPAFDGSFWVSFESICLRFGSLYLNWNPDLFPNVQKINFFWSISAINTFADTQVLATNPQFNIQNNSNRDNIVWILICQHLTDPGGIKGYIGLTVYDAGGNRVYVPNDVQPIKQGPYLNTFQYLLKFEVPANTAYTLAVTASEKDSKYSLLNFTITAYSVFPIIFEKPKEKLRYKTTLDSEWTTDLSGGNWSYQSYFDNPRFSLKVTEKAKIVNLLVYSQTKYPMNVRVFSETDKLSRNIKKKREIVSSGDYRVGYTTARLVYLEPGDYTVVVSLYEPKVVGSFTIICRSCSDCQFTQLPSISAGFFDRSLIVAWKNRVRIEIPVNVRVKSMAYFNAVSLPEEPIDEDRSPEIKAFYRPHMRLSIFDKTAGKLLQTNDFTDDRLGIFLEKVQLFSNTDYICLVERMECGTGRIKINVSSESPVVMRNA